VTEEGVTAPDPNARTPLSPGTKVDVRNRYQGTWVRGFEVAEFTGEGYLIRRLSDGSVLGELVLARRCAEGAVASGLLVALTGH